MLFARSCVLLFLLFLLLLPLLLLLLALAALAAFVVLVVLVVFVAFLVILVLIVALRADNVLLFARVPWTSSKRAPRRDALPSSFLCLHLLFFRGGPLPYCPSG